MCVPADGILAWSEPDIFILGRFSRLFYDYRAVGISKNTGKQSSEIFEPDLCVACRNLRLGIFPDGRDEKGVVLSQSYVCVSERRIQSVYLSECGSGACSRIWYSLLRDAAERDSKAETGAVPEGRHIGGSDGMSVRDFFTLHLFSCCRFL